MRIPSMIVWPSRLQTFSSKSAPLKTGPCRRHTILELQGTQGRLLLVAASGVVLSRQAFWRTRRPDTQRRRPAWVKFSGSETVDRKDALVKSRILGSPRCQSRTVSGRSVATCRPGPTLVSLALREPVLRVRGTFQCWRSKWRSDMTLWRNRALELVDHGAETVWDRWTAALLPKAVHRDQALKWSPRSSNKSYTFRWCTFTVYRTSCQWISLQLDLESVEMVTRTRMLWVTELYELIM